MNWHQRWKLLWLGVLLASAQGASAATCGLPAGLSEDQQFAFAERMVADGLLTSARDYLSCYRASEPNGQFRSQAMQLEGEVLMRMGEEYWSQAFVVFEEWLREHPEHPAAPSIRLKLGNIHFRFGRMQSTEEALEPIPASAEEYAQARFLMGQAVFRRSVSYRQKNAPTQADQLAAAAASYLEVALQGELNPAQQLEAHYQAGYARYVLQQYEQVPPHWESYLAQAEASPQREETRYLLASAHRRLEQWPQAEQRYGEVAVTTQEISATNQNLAKFWWGEAAFQRGLAEVRQSEASELNPSFAKELTPRYESYLATEEATYRPLAAFRLGVLYSAAEQPQEAIAAYERYLETRDEAYRQAAHYQLGVLHAQQNEPRAAIKHLEPLQDVPTYRRDPAFWNLMAQQYAAIPDEPRLESLLLAASEAPEFSRRTRLQFLLRLTTRQYQARRCLDLLDTLVRYDEPADIPEAQQLYQQRGSCFYLEKKWALARKDLQRVRHVPAYRPTIFRSLVAINRQLEDGPALQETLAWGAEPEVLLRDADWQLWVEELRKQEDWEALLTVYARWDSRADATLRERPEHLLQWARAHRQVGQTTEEARLLEDVLFLLPEQPDALREQTVGRLATLYQEQDRVADIPKLYQIHLLALLPEEAPKYRDYALYLGELYQRQLNNEDQALPWLEEADRGGQTPTEVRAALLRAGIHQQRGETDLALPIWRRLSLQQADASAQFLATYRLATLLAERKQWDEALQQFEEVSRLPAPRDQDLAMQQDAATRATEIRQFVFQRDLKDQLERRDWPAVSTHIRTHWEQGLVQLTPALLQTWVHAEQQQARWQGVLTVYNDVQKREPQRALTTDDLIWQGEAHEQLKQPREAVAFYERALKELPADDERRPRVSARLVRLYEASEDHEKQLQLYERLYAETNRAAEKQQYALRAGILSLQKLQNERRGAEWLSKVDQGGTSDVELQSALLLTELDQNNENYAIALERLQQFEQREVPASSQWSWPLQFQIGVLHQASENWEEARPYLERVAAQQEDPELQTQAAQRLQSVEQIIARQQLRALTDQERWSEVGPFVEAELDKGTLTFDPPTTNAWLRAETQAQNWEKVLAIYARLRQERPAEAETPAALIAQGQAAEGLGGWLRARDYYEAALQQTPASEEERRLTLMERLRHVFEKDPRDNKADFPPIVVREYDSFRQLENRRQLAQLLVFWARERSNDPQLEREWLVKLGNLDSGESSLQARIQLAELQQQDGNTEQAIQTLEQTLSPELTPAAPFYLSIHQRLANWHQAQEQWMAALRHHQAVLKLPESPANETARQQAKEQIISIRQFLSTQQLNTAREQEDWPQVSQQIQRGLNDGSLAHSEELYRLWLEAETRQENWPRVGAIYDQLAERHPESVTNLADYQNRGFAASQAGDPSQSVAFYTQAYAVAQPPQQRDFALQLAELQKDQPREALSWLEKAYLQSPPEEQEAIAWQAQAIAQSLNDWQLEEPWLRKLDQGGNSDTELQALWRRVERAEQTQNAEQEREALQAVLQRDPSPQTSWFVLAHFRLGKSFQEAERWEEAEYAYLQAAQSEPPAEYADVQTAARQQWKALSQRGLNDKLDRLEQNEDWAGMSYLIRKEHLAGTLQLDPPIFALLVRAEVEQQNWKGVLKAYQLLEKDDPPQTQTADAHLQRARATLQLQGWAPAADWYQKAWQATGADDPTQQLAIVDEAGPAFENAEQVPQLVALYEQTYPHLQDPALRRRCAQTIIFYAQGDLKDEAKARQWIAQLDQGGNADEDLAALWAQAREALQTNETAKAQEILQTLLARDPAPESLWYVLAHYQLGVQAQQAQEWTNALGHYESAAQAPAPEEGLEYQQLARQQADQISDYLAKNRLQTLIQEQRWAEVAGELRPTLEAQGERADLQQILVWRRAELEQQNWEGALASWRVQRQVNERSTLNAEALWQQGALQERLEQPARALNYYQQLLQRFPESVEGQQARKRIADIYLQQGDLQQLVVFLEEQHERTTDPEVKRAYALQIAEYYAVALQQPEQALQWWEQADQGGTSNAELEAGFELAKADINAGRSDSALLRLQNLARRELPPASQWFVLIHYQLAALHHTQEQYPEALEHYRMVATHPGVKGLEEYHSSSKELADAIAKYLAQLE